MQERSPILSVAVGVLLVALPLLYHRVESIFANELASCATLLFAAVIAGGLLCSLLVRSGAMPRYARATAGDLAAGLFLLWGVVGICVTGSAEVDAFLWYRWGAVAACYWLVRTMVYRRVLLYALFLSGVVQSFVAAGQRAGVASSHHVVFDVTASFGNPGQLGGYVAVCLVAGVGLLSRAIRQRARVGACLLAAGSAVQCCGLYLSDSRAGAVGVALGLAAWFAPRIVAGFKKRRVAFAAAAALLLAAASVLLYCYRPASANARLLIWRVSADMVADRPLLGHGVGAFAKKYMLYQAAYFEKNPTSPFALVADNATAPFNELLHLAIAQGAVGLLLFLLLLFVALTSRPAGASAKAFKAALVALVAFSLFSYPSDVFPLLLLYAVCLGGIGGKPAALRCKLPRWCLAAGVLCSAAVAWQGVREGIYIRRLSGALSELLRNPTNEGSVDAVGRSCERMKHNVAFHDCYMAWLNSRPDLLARSESVKNILPSCEGYCLLGKHYSACGDIRLAEQAFLTAASMAPTRIRPKFYLWVLYVEQGEAAAAADVAQKILHSPVKAESIYTLRVKGQMRQFLEQNSRR